MKECPFLYSNSNPDLPDCNCVKDHCAWWDKDNEQCSILTLVSTMSRVINAEFQGGF